MIHDGDVLGDVVAYLVCPLCAADLGTAGGSVRCADGHSFDVARQGYVNLLPGDAHTGTADTAAMVEARAAFLADGHFAPLAALLADHVAPFVAEPGCVLDAGAGTGYYLSAVLEQSPAAVGAAFDISKFAARRAAKAHPRIGAVVWDLWRRLPFRSGSARAVLNVFAPRNPAEYRRVLSPDGALFLITPTSRHLRELIGPLGLLSVDDDKIQQVDAALRGQFELAAREDHEIGLRLPRTAVETLAQMGPSAWHTTAQEIKRKLDPLPDPTPVTISTTLSVYRPTR